MANNLEQITRCDHIKVLRKDGVTVCSIWSVRPRVSIAQHEFNGTHAWDTLVTVKTASPMEGEPFLVLPFEGGSV